MSSCCLFSALYLPSMGGVERFTDSLASELARQGHDVVIVTNDTHGMGPHEVLESGVEVFRLPCHCIAGGRFPIPVRNKTFSSIWDAVCSHTFDGILINTRFYLHTLLGLQCAKSQGLTPVVLDHGSAYLTFGNPVLDVCAHVYEHAITARVKCANSAFYGISDKSVEWLRTFGIKAQGVISNSIDAAVYRAQTSDRSFRKMLGIDADRLMLAFTGRLIPEKGVDVLIEMMRLLENTPVDLVVAGDGPLRTRIENANLPHLHVTGRLEQSDIAALLLEADLFCLPTRSEGFSTSLLESVACATPFVVTDVGGARELAPSEDYGFVVMSAKPEVFADVVHRVLDDGIDLRAMGTRCCERLESSYSWSAVAHELLRAFEEQHTVP